MDIGLDTVVKVAPHQASCELKGETAILNVRTGVYYSLDRVGVRVWQMLQRPAAVRVLRDAIVREYDVGPQACEKDLLKLLGELDEAGLLVRESSCSASG